MEDRFIDLRRFHARRDWYRNEVALRQLDLVTCPCCGFPTLGPIEPQPICDLCFWQDDGQDDPDAGFYSAPNGMTLEEGRRRVERELVEWCTEKGGDVLLDLDRFLQIAEYYRGRLEIHYREAGEADRDDPVWKGINALRDAWLADLVVERTPLL
ncbi:CPCC family cysteine-rich protein [Flaviaesturariibacter aridisoli]|nr:CPCC family cysteine-rich protein [Flaviaesturariibacter aridisoli]